MDWPSGTPMTDPLFAASSAFSAQSLHGKTAVVTGSSRGIGAGIARRLAALGARVVINYSKDEVGAEAVVQAINADRPTVPPTPAATHNAPIADDASDAEMADAEPMFSPSKLKPTPAGDAPASTRAIAVRADVSTIAGGQALVAACMRAYGRLDILILNAGVNSSGTLAETEEDEFDAQFALHVKGPLFLAKACAEVMHDGGRIIFLSHMATKKSTILPSYILICSTRGAIEQLSRTLSKELTARGITVNCIVPGPIDTPGLRAQFSDHKMKFVAGLHPMKRNGKVADIAGIAGYLCTSEAEWISGQCISVNGALIT